MKITGFIDLVKKIAGFIPIYNIEKFIFKILLGVWAFVILTVVILKAVLGTRDDIERRITEAATNVKFSTMKKSDIVRYESLLNLAKYPEGIEKYTRLIDRDPFSEYKKKHGVQIFDTAQYDFVLESIEKVQLPMIYRGYIELTDMIIGQINWHDTTRFIKVGSTINGYKIQDISKEKIEVIDANGKLIVFELNKPVYGEELQAILYDNISKKTFSVRLATTIGTYKVIDITPEYVILLAKGVEIKLKK
jgi:hypothetical protein